MDDATPPDRWPMDPYASVSAAPAADEPPEERMAAPAAVGTAAGGPSAAGGGWTDVGTGATGAEGTDETMSAAEMLVPVASEARVAVGAGDSVVEEQTPVGGAEVAAAETEPSGVDVEREGRIPGDDDDAIEWESQWLQFAGDDARSDEEGAAAGAPGEPSVVTTRSADGERPSEPQGAAGSFRSDASDAVEPAAGSIGDSRSWRTRMRSSSAEYSRLLALSLPLRVTLVVAGLVVLAGLWHSPPRRLGHGRVFEPWRTFSRGHHHHHHHHHHVPPPPPPGGPFPDMASVHTLADLLSHLFVPAWGVGRAFRRGCWCDRRSPWYEAVDNADHFLDELSLLEDGGDYVVRIPMARVHELSRASRQREWKFPHAEARHDRHGTGALGWFWAPWPRLGWRRFFGRHSHRHRLRQPRWAWGWRHGPHHHSSPSWKPP